jgi:hypothetical protein
MRESHFWSQATLVDAPNGTDDATVNTVLEN